jgi:hypothetical protein
MGLFLLLPLHPMRPHLISWAGGRVGGYVLFVAEAGDGALRLAQDGALRLAQDGALRLAQDGADAGGRGNISS